MSKIIDAASVGVKDSRVLFDTNVWILINDFSATAAQHRADIYSGAYKSLLANNNTIVINNYIIGEFFNRCANIQYKIRAGELKEAGSPVPSYKTYRQSAEFRDTLETIRDTCLHMIDDCEFISIDGHHYDIRSVVTGCCDNCADFSDLMIIGFCKHEKLSIMTDDADYAHCGLEVITANKKMVSRA